MLSFIPGFEKFPEIEIDIKPIQKRKCAIEKVSGEKINQFTMNDDINGTINIKLMTPMFEHQGISIELIGAIIQNDIQSEFMNLSKEIEPPGEIIKSTTYDFNFKKVELSFESYEGINISVRYMIRLTLLKKFFGTKKTIEKSFYVVNPIMDNLTINPDLKMDLGKDDLKMEFEFFHSKFHLKDCILGKVTFHKINFKMKSLELQLIRKETSFSKKLAYLDNKTDNTLINKFEVIDGNAVSGDVIPIRMFLGGCDLSPTYINVNNLFSLRYFLKIVIIDDDDKHFFKQQEITLWRKEY